MTVRVNRKAIGNLQRQVSSLVNSVPLKERTLPRFKKRARRKQGDYWTPAELMVAAALVNQTKWDSVVAPRLREFRRCYPRTRTIEALLRLLNRMNDRQVSVRVLDWGERVRHYRVALLRGLVSGFVKYGRSLESKRGRSIDDYEVLRQWGREKDPQDKLEESYGGRIPGLGPKLVAWLRMYGGDFQTVPFDVYTEEGMARLGLADMGRVAEFIADICHVPRYTLDKAFRGQKDR